MKILLLFIIASAACFAGPFDALTPAELDARASEITERWLRQSGLGVLGREEVQRTRVAEFQRFRRRLVGREIMKAYARTYCRPGEERVYAAEIERICSESLDLWLVEDLASRGGDLTTTVVSLEFCFRVALEREAAYR